MKKYIGILAVLLIVGGMALLLVNNKKNMKEQTASTVTAENSVTVSIYTIEEESFEFEFSSNGTLQAMNELTYVSDVSGRVSEIFVDKGTRVAKGTPLLKIDTELLEVDYTANLAAYEALKKDEQRFSRSNEAGGVTSQQLDNIRTQLTAAESRMKVSRKRLADATVKSPMDGTINFRYVEHGSLIAPNVPLFDIVNDNRLKVVCNVSETKVKQLSKGQAVTVTNNNLQGTVFTGHINFIGIKTDRGLNYPVEVLMDKNEQLRIGMYLKVNFVSGQQRTGILVPRNAIVGSAKAANVFLMRDGKAVQQEVDLGEMVGDRVEILGGLSQGDVVITSGLMNIANGTNVIQTKNDEL